MPAFLGNFRHSIRSSIRPVYIAALLCNFSVLLLDNSTFLWGYHWRYYPSIVNSFGLGEIGSIDKDGFMQITNVYRRSNIQQ